MTKIFAERFPMLSSAEVDTALYSRSAAIIPDGAALTIASYWMSPEAALAELVHTRRADADALLDEIDSARDDECNPWEQRALHALRMWVISKRNDSDAEAKYDKIFDVD
jgi:hypothetical protein